VAKLPTRKCARFLVFLLGTLHGQLRILGSSYHVIRIGCYLDNILTFICRATDVILKLIQMVLAHFFFFLLCYNYVYTTLCTTLCILTVECWCQKKNWIFCFRFYMCTFEILSATVSSLTRFMQVSVTSCHLLDLACLWTWVHRSYCQRVLLFNIAPSCSHLLAHVLLYFSWEYF